MHCNDVISCMLFYGSQIFFFKVQSDIKLNLNFWSKMRFYKKPQKTRGTQPDLEFKAHDNYFYLAELRV